MPLQPVNRRLARMRGNRDERGAVAIVVALAMTTLLIITAMVLDFGLARVDRQTNKSASDAATSAGVYALDGPDGKPRDYQGVCTAIRYLRENDARFAGVTSGSGVWTDGNGSALTDPCGDSTLLQTHICVGGDKSTWGVFTWNGSWEGDPMRVVIQSGYQLAGSGWQEESLLASDQTDDAQGCNQLAVMITENRQPGLGSLATSSDLVTSVRSVGRVKPGPGGDAPAMLLLKRTGCPSLQVGSTAGSSWVKVLGKYSPSTGASQPGTIHADADGSGCSDSVFYGKAASGIVAYAAPLASGAPDPKKPGQITSVAATHGLSSYDSISNVYSSDQVSGTGGAHSAASGRKLVTRKPVDDRYLATVRTAISQAQTSVFGSLTAGNAVASGYDVATCNSNGTVTLPSPAASTKLYVDCSLVKSSPPIPYQTVVFNGGIAPGNPSTISMPNADHVYIFGNSGDAVSLGTGGALSVHANTTTFDSSTGQCMSGVVAGSKAVVFVRNGDLKETGGLLRLCNTTVFMMGGQPDGCLPAGYSDIASAPAPTQTPCAGTTGNGQIKQTGGSVDWTAPNVLDKTMEANGDPTSDALTNWTDPNGPEDLALWDESAGTNNNPAYTMAGGGTFHLQGIFMVPNADPFSLTGNSNLVLTNAQFVVTSLALASNNTTLQMAVDPNATVTLPKLHVVGLVR